MILQEKIQKKAKGFSKLAPVFLEGAKFALENQWISVEDDLPCNHNELIDSEDNYLTQFVIAIVNGFVCLSRMEKIYDDWHWKTDVPTHWMPIPNLPKE